MPVREPEELVTTTFGKHKFTYNASFWKELDARIETIDKWNDAVKVMSKEFYEELSAIYGEGLVVEPCRYNNATDNEGCEKFKPRNYLSYEGLRIKVLSIDKVYFFGQYENIYETLNTIKKELDELRTKTEENRRSNESDIESDGV